MEIDNSPELPELNDDILAEILKNLPIRDRQNAKLVCRRWLRISRYRIFAQKEAIFFPHFYSLPSIMKILKRNQHEMLNIKFEYRKFDKNSTNFWIKFGKKFASLQFYGCQFKRRIIQQIFSYCVNLTEFIADSCSICHFRQEEGQLFESIFQPKTTLIRENLTKLHLYSSSLAVTETDLRIISSTFPKLKSLKIYLMFDVTSGRGNAQTISILFETLQTELKQIETLHTRFHRHDEEELVDFSSMGTHNLDRLKNAAIPLEPFISNEESLNAILRFKFWTSFDLYWRANNTADIAVLFRLFDECPLLENFKFSWQPTNVQDFVIIFTALVKSRLKFLDIRIMDFARTFVSSQNLIREASISLITLINNHSVRKLHIVADHSPEYGAFFVKYFRNALALYLKPGIPNLVFEYQENLRKLEIVPLHFSRTIPVPAKTTMKNLEFLHLRPLDLNVSSSFQFPNLKYLIITDSKELSQIQNREEEGLFEDLWDDMLIEMDVDENVVNHRIRSTPYTGNNRHMTQIFMEKFNLLMCHVFRKSHLLQGIQIECHDLPLRIEAFRVVFQSCRYFRSLRYISFRCSPDFLNEDDLKKEIAEHLDQCCFSLRAVWIDTPKFKVHYFLNVIEGKFQFLNKFTDFSPVDEFHEKQLTDCWRYER